MCGIIGVASKGNNVITKLMNGLEKLEYRGYDSAGIAVLSTEAGVSKIIRERAVGKLDNLKEILSTKDLQASVGIGHTRWATHGKPCINNAHPMMSSDVAIVHNGIIENYKALKFELENDGFIFESQTDTEVIAHLLQKQLSQGSAPLEAVKTIVHILEGTFAIAAIFSAEPDKIFATRRKSSLAVGFGENMCIGSDAASLSGLSSEITYLENDDIVEISQHTAIFYDKNLNIITREKHIVVMDDICEGKGQYEHFMLKEIMDQPSAIRKTIQFNKIDSNILNGIDRILIVACGTSYYAGIVAKYWFEKFLRIPTDVEIASEYRYRSPVISANTLMISISQSGETLDTLAAIEFIKSNSNCKTAAIVNVKNSAIARISDVVFYTEAGVEIGVASTKAFTAQLSVLASIAFCKNDFLTHELKNVPALCEEILNTSNHIKEIANKISKHHNAIYLGRGLLFPIALEGALKLKEISYVHAEGFAAGEMKHGPIALIDDQVPVVCLCPSDELFEKTTSNVQEALARGKNIIVVTDAQGSLLLPKEIVNSIVLPHIHSALTPILYSIPLQLLAYYSAINVGADVDRPRNLAKSVTVE